MRLPLILATTALAATALAACGTDTTATDDPSPTDTATSSPSPTEPSTPDPSDSPTDTPSDSAATGAAAYFLLDTPTGDTGPYLTPVWLPSAADLTDAVEGLLAGPEAALQGTTFTATGLNTAVPDGTTLLDATISGGVAIVDLSGTFDDGGGSTAMISRLTQVIWTATQFDDVDAVEVRMDGETVEFFSGEGLVLDQPLTRDWERDYGLVPKLFVDRPAYGETVGSSFEMTGIARDLFEATFTWELSDSADEIYATGPVTAEGSEGWNSYTTTVAWTPDEAQPVTLTVLEASAEDGSTVFDLSRPIFVDPAS